MRARNSRARRPKGDLKPCKFRFFCYDLVTVNALEKAAYCPAMKMLARITVVGSLVLFVGSAFAAPVGFSVNSDAPDGDELHSIDLADGTATVRGLVRSGVETFTDVEGLAFDAEGQLWAVDDQSMSLFPVSTGNGTVDLDSVVSLNGLTAVSGNDFGMTFTCSGSLFVSSVADGALYRVGYAGSELPAGTATRVGDLSENISALASFGNPPQLFGLSNGQVEEGGAADSRSLYEIDPATGALTLVGALGPAPAAYVQAGLSFDEEGNLWAITDRRINGEDLGSEILSIDPTSGIATVVATTGTGFESLAVAPPSGCAAAPPPPGQHRDGITNIPTLDAAGKGAAILALLLTGLLVLRQRS